jgi:hypothetical protein
MYDWLSRASRSFSSTAEYKPTKSEDEKLDVRDRRCPIDNGNSKIDSPNFFDQAEPSCRVVQWAMLDGVLCGRENHPLAEGLDANSKARNNIAVLVGSFPKSPDTAVNRRQWWLSCGRRRRRHHHRQPPPRYDYGVKHAVLLRLFLLLAVVVEVALLLLLLR